MRGITVARVLSYLTVLLFLAGLSAMPSHAQTCPPLGISSTPYLVFGPQAVGQSGLTQTTTITFTTACGPGATTVTINSISISGANPGDFVATGNADGGCSSSLTFGPVPDSISCTLAVTFTPSALGTRTATVSINYSSSQPAGAALSTGVNVIGGDEIVYVTTGVGGQVLIVDGFTPGVFEVLQDAPFACEGICPFNPTGAVVGPDGRIYVTDQVNSGIWRINPDGSGATSVYSGSSCPDSSPCKVEGPSFSASGNGDLYFNTYYNDGIFVIPGAANAPVGGPFNPPASVNTYPEGGTGTAFDGNGNLLASDVEFPVVWTIPPPYTASATEPAELINDATSIVVPGSPAGIALNKFTGQVFVADPQADLNELPFNGIMQVVPPVPPSATYTTTPYYAFTSESACDSPDEVEYIQSDMTGHLFATTSTSPISFGPAGNGCGKVWRIDPGASPTATLLLDLNAVYTSGIADVCAPGCGLNATQAIGVAIGPTQGPTQSVPLSSSGGTYSVGVPLTCTPSLAPPNNCSAAITGVYPAGIYSSGDSMNITFNEVSQQQYLARLGPGSPYAMTTLAPVAGWNGNGIVPSLVCLNSSGNACDDTVAPGTSYEIFTTWQTNQTNYCGMTPHLLRGDPVGGPYSGPDGLLVDTLVPGSCLVVGEPGAGSTGKSTCTTTSSSTCASDWLNSTGAVTGSTSGITATATITTPASGANFLLNQSETATYSCSQTPVPPPSIVVFCPGIVTEPNGAIASVVSGGALPTSQAGSYTLSVNPNVDGGSPGTGATAQYTVSACQDIGLTFNPSTVAVGKSTIASASLQSCNSSTELAVVQFNLTGPLGKACAISTTPELSLPFILSSKPIDFSFKLTIPSGACAGTYTLSSNTYVKGTLVSTSSSSLVVTAH